MTTAGRARPLACFGLGIALGVPLLLAERWLSADAAGRGDVRLDNWASFLASLFFFAPLQEGAELFAAWIPMRGRGAPGPRVAIRCAAAAAAGFALVRIPLYLLASPHGAATFIRAALLVPAHLFCAAVWGYALVTPKPDHEPHAKPPPPAWQPLAIALAVATLLHGLYDHLVQARQIVALVGVAPLLIGMVVVTSAASRDLGGFPGTRGLKNVALLRSLPPPPSIGAVRKALRRAERPVMLRWTLFGALVTTGVMISAVALVIYLGRRFGVDFSTVDEGDAASTVPLALVGVAGLLAFPISGYLVARASAAESVLEPALSAGVTIAAVLVLFGFASTVALVFALAVAPIAFGLACAGAWLGLEGS